MTFTIHTNPDDYDYIWECLLSGCGCTNLATNRTTRRKAWKDAVQHAKECLADHRTRQGTDEWPIHFTVQCFMNECMSIEARGPADWTPISKVVVAGAV